MQTCSPEDCKPGDLIAWAPVNWRSSLLGWAIGHTVSAATWPWNLDFPVCHAALVAPHGEQSALYESTIDKGLGRCLDTAWAPMPSVVKGVQAHPLHQRLELHLHAPPVGRGGRAWRLPWLGRGSYDAVGQSRMNDRLEIACVARLGVPYDLLGAFQARSFGFGWTRRYRAPRVDANRKFYCNEYCLDVYSAMGWVGPDVIPSHENPKSTVALLVDGGICGAPQEIKL